MIHFWRPTRGMCCSCKSPGGAKHRVGQAHQCLKRLWLQRGSRRGRRVKGEEIVVRRANRRRPGREATKKLMQQRLTRVGKVG